ncbi:MAG: glycosyltransferase family 39 protein [Blastocatellia bacterium]
MIQYSAYSTALPDHRYSRATIFEFFIALAAVSFILRIWYAGNLSQDDGLWFTAAEEILRGKALYREIFFDKPPGLPLLYAALFKIFGPHIMTIRLFTICYSVVISGLLYLFGSRLYDKRTGLISAAMFSVFSTTYVSGDMQSLNTEFLMTPFYAAGAYLFILSGMDFIRSGNTGVRALRLALAGGCVTGVAFQINPKGVFDLIFLAILLIAAPAIGLARRSKAITYVAAASRLIAVGVAGFILASLPFLLYVGGTNSLSHYKSSVWDWGFRYAAYYPAWRAGEVFLRHGTDYFLINNTLLIGLVVTVAVTFRQALGRFRDEGKVHLDQGSRSVFESDAALLIWFAVSFVGVATGGRFFAHYYFQVLPSLCLIGARGLVEAILTLRARDRLFRRMAISLLIAGFLYTLVRSHSDTAQLASDLLRGEGSKVNREARIVAAVVRDMPDPANAVDRPGAESIRDGGPRNREANGSSDYLFVWGNWPEIYYWSGLLPASRYLSTQPLTGVPADVQYAAEGYRSILDATVTAAARTDLLRDLEQTQPEYIVDELGFRDEQLSIRRYPELNDFMKNYDRHSPDDRFPIYIRRASER